MSVRVRLTRVGSKKNPIWRVVVTDQRSPRDGRFIETIGRYNPQTNPSTIAIDEERLGHWIARGAQPSGAVKQLMKAQAKSGGAAAGVPGAESGAESSEPADAAEAAEPAQPEVVAAGDEAVTGEPEAAGAEPELAAAGPESATEDGGEPEPAPGAEPAETDPGNS